MNHILEHVAKPSALRYREEVLTAHYPKSDDEWMIREMSFLTQFTRIFPPENGRTINATGQLEVGNIASSFAIGGDDTMEAREDDGDNDDEEDIKGAAVNTVSTTNIPSSSASLPYKPATYEDILYQVFLQDKRQAMRLRCPLPNRHVKPSDNDTQSLPPVEKSKGYLYNSMAANVREDLDIVCNSNVEFVGWKRCGRLETSCLSKWQ